MNTLFLHTRIEKSYVLPYVRNYLTLVTSPQAHPAFKCSFNFGCTGRHIISLLSEPRNITQKASMTLNLNIIR